MQRELAGRITNIDLPQALAALQRMGVALRSYVERELKVDTATAAVIPASSSATAEEDADKAADGDVPGRSEQVAEDAPDAPDDPAPDDSDDDREGRAEEAG